MTAAVSQPKRTDEVGQHPVVMSNFLHNEVTYPPDCHDRLHATFTGLSTRGLLPAILEAPTLIPAAKRKPQTRLSKLRRRRRRRRR